jgi:ADP-ribosyl-[dinitrogen reductase] hydrolase
LGRSGTFVAKILTTFGVSAEMAIKQVRNARPGAIESKIQEQYINNGQRLDN